MGSESESRSAVSDSLQQHGLYSSWDSPGQNTGVGTLSLLQGIFPTQVSNPGLPHCRRILYHLSHKESPAHQYTLKGKTTVISAITCSSFPNLFSLFLYFLNFGLLWGQSTRRLGAKRYRKVLTCMVCLWAGFAQAGPGRCLEVKLFLGSLQQ